MKFPFIILVALCTCLSSSKLFAQPIINLTDSTQGIFIGKSILYLIDTSKKLSISDVQAPSITTKFLKSEKEVPNLGNVEVVVWNKFTVANHSTKSWILSDLNDNDTLHFYYKDTSGNWASILSGVSMPASTRKYKTNLYAFDLPVKQGDTASFYLRVSTRNCEYTLVVSDHEEFAYESFKRVLFNGFYIGLVFVIIIYNISWFLAVKDRVYVYYMFYVLFTALLIFVMTGIYPFFLGDRFHFLWDRGPAITALGGTFLCMFGIRFLGLKQKAPLFHLLLTYVFIPFMAFNFALTMLGNSFLASVLNQVVGVAGLITLSIAAVLVYRRGFKAARFYILACSSYFVGVFIYVLKAFAVLPYNLITRHAMEVGSAVEMIMFSVSMTDRINIFRKEKLIAHREKLAAQEELISSLQEKTEMQRHMLELEAAALRSQMNPHFIFNCLNSIKALIQQGEDEQAVTYLTTFAKLLRTILQNSDKREISLYDEIETCRLYTQLESLRFSNKFSYTFSVDKYIDLKSIEVPALILQPFIENAIWHGIMPKDGDGHIDVSVNRFGEEIVCTIDDNGVGRNNGNKNKLSPDASHQSKGLKITQSRIDLDNQLHDRRAAVKTIDKMDEYQQPAGTRIVLTFKEYEK